MIHSVCRGSDFMQDVQAIKGLATARSDWLRQASENLTNGSPTTAAITWLLWQWAKQHRSWNDVFTLEEEISAWKIQHADFIEGVRARLVDKDLQPAWQAQDYQTLRELFPHSIPKSEHIDSWNALLRQYGILID